MPIEVIVTPIWTAEMYSLTLAQLLERERRALGAFLAHHFQARAARAHERVLGDHEERVDRDQQRPSRMSLSPFTRARRLAGRAPSGASVSQPAGRGAQPTGGATLLRGSSSSSFIALVRPHNRSKAGRAGQRDRVPADSGEPVDRAPPA